MHQFSLISSGITLVSFGLRNSRLVKFDHAYCYLNSNQFFFLIFAEFAGLYCV